MQQKTTEETQVQNMVQPAPEQSVGVTDDFRAMIPEDYGFNLSDFALFMSVMKVKI